MDPACYRILPMALLAALAVSGCQREAEVPGGRVGTDGAAAASPSAATAQGDAPGHVELEDMMESGPGYIIGISYPPGINRYPGLAAEVKRYADDARAGLMEAVEAREPVPGSGAVMPYDLALPFDMVMESPDIVAVQATGTVYTGGAHGNPLVARFVWLPERGEMLRVEALIQAPDGLQAVSDFVRESLYGALSHRLDADGIAPEDRQRLLRSGGRMIEEGTAPEPGNFAHFEPVQGTGVQLRALRFVFPPYQVGPYSDGVQTVEVPASVLLPHVAPGYRALFVGG